MVDDRTLRMLYGPACDEKIISTELSMKLYTLCHDWLTPPDQGLDPETIMTEVFAQTAEDLADAILQDEAWLDGDDYPRVAVVKAMAQARADVLASALRLECDDDAVQRGEPCREAPYTVYHRSEDQRWYCNAAGVTDNLVRYGVAEGFAGPGQYGPLEVQRVPAAR